MHNNLVIVIPTFFTYSVSATMPLERLMTQRSINYKTRLRRPVTDKQGCVLLMISIQIPCRSLKSNTHHLEEEITDLFDCVCLTL